MVPALCWSAKCHQPVFSDCVDRMPSLEVTADPPSVCVYARAWFHWMKSEDCPIIHF